MNIRQQIKNGKVIFDGAMGTMLQKAGMKAGEIPELYNVEKKEIVQNIHREYLRAGSMVVSTNTFGANRFKLEDTQYSVEDIVAASIDNAKQAIEEEKADALVALDIGPLGKLLAPLGTLEFETAYSVFREIVEAGEKAGADLYLIETISDLYEAKAAILACKEAGSKPIFCTMTFDEDGRTLTGCDVLTMVTSLEAFGVDALGINCSLGPEETAPLIEQVLQYASVPVMVQPNAGLPQMDGETTYYDVKPEEFAGICRGFAEKGVRILGGCCGTDEKFIRMLCASLEDVEIPLLPRKQYTAVTSGNQTVVLGQGKRIIGERINPTGKKKLKEALKDNDMEYILNEAIKQVDNHADILDVNVGLPEIDEGAVWVKAVREIQEVLNVPLQIDSVRADVIEKAVRLYNGKPLINSVNGKASSMEEIFPIVKKYGACVLGLTIDENGIPPKAEDRAAIARKIVETASRYGIAKKDILIDTLCLTASAQQEEVLETVKALTLIKKELGVATVLGVSNVSFGLPNRGLLNATFLSMALFAGLDAPILNPLDDDIMGAYKAYKVLAFEDKDSLEYVQEYKDYVKAAGTKNVSASQETAAGNLKEMIMKGLKEEARTETKRLLQEEQPLTIVNEQIIPALDEVGEKFERKELFLPQLIVSAETVKGAFEHIKEEIQRQGSANDSKGSILLATVKGDIHDIGKNIVKVLLENYGYKVYDLGKDVDIDLVVSTAREHNIRLVGLSALMTTTVLNMKKTIAALRENNIDCKVMVGGAVLNPEYADMIGADYYAKDARESVKIADEFFEV